MSGKYPTPARRGGKWEVDLRGWGYGWHYALGAAEGPQAISEVQATHAAYAKLDELRRCQEAERHAQLALPQGAPASFAGALDEWQRRKEYGDNADSQRYGDCYAGLVREELGQEPLSALVGQAGEDRLLAYKRALVARGLAPNTIRNRFSIAKQVLVFCSSPSRRWLPHVPQLPEMPARRPPRFEWISEPTFRLVRGAIYADPGPAGRTARGNLTRWLRASGSYDTKEQWIARRRCYLSWAFYTGSHKRDCDNASDRRIFLDGGEWTRHNSKSARCVEDDHFDMPEQLVRDLRELLSLLGREAFFCGEAVFGGPWDHADTVLADTQLACKVPGARLNLPILRRSHVRELARRGYTIMEIAHRLGHVDLRMIREVYLQTPRPPGRLKTRWTTEPLTASEPPPGGARVLPLRRQTP